MKHRKILSINGLDYLLTISDEYEIVFSVVGGNLPSGQGALSRKRNELFSPAPTRIIRGVKNPVKVFREIVKELKSWIYENEPPMLKFFSYDTDRNSLYRKLAERTLSSEYEFLYEYNGEFFLSRRRK